MNEFDVNKISIKDISTNVYTGKNYKISFEDFMRLGYTEQQAEELMKYAEYIDEMLPIENINETTMNLIDRFCEVGNTGYPIRAEDLRQIIKQ